MSVDYTNLWKLLIEKHINKSQLKDAAHISTNAVAKLGRNESVSLDTLEKICIALSCTIGDIMSFTTTSIPESTQNKNPDPEKVGTFSLNKYEPIHRWFSYIEGYSSAFIESELNRLESSGKAVKTIYDPFSGTGTTNLVAAFKGIKSFYSESNAFMKKVIDTKINSVRAFNARYSSNALRHYLQIIQNSSFNEYKTWDGFEKYFDQPQLSHLLSIKAIIQQENDPVIRSLLMLALSSITVKVSKMTRRGDLRYATGTEYRPSDVTQEFITKLLDIIQDIDEWSEQVKCEATLVSSDARENNYVDTFDCVITSPPYLNGTNYIRNTKLELKLNDFIQTEDDLSFLHSQGIVSGINNVSKRSGHKNVLPEVQPYFDELIKTAYDNRIPKMVAGYFYDMNEVLACLRRSMCSGGYFIMDIGDSQFGGVHIPTHEILTMLCYNHGFYLYDNEILRKRHSKNGMTLTQQILRFRLVK